MSPAHTSGGRIDTLQAWHDIVRQRDFGALQRILADDCVFHSPVVFAPQRGKAVTAGYLAAALKVLGDAGFRYVREVVAERDAVLEFEAELEGVYVNGVDLIRWDEAGRIVDFKVMVRPLKAVNALHQRMAVALSERGAPTL
ncbi:MAG: nuclear transport factor 2 family protein [Lysobacterales bacterium]